MSQHILEGDYPPVPECFSCLLQNDTVIAQSNMSLTQTESDKTTASPKDDQLRLAQTLPSVRSQSNAQVQMDLTEEKLPRDSAIALDFSQDEEYEDSTLQGTFQKLNFSLGKLHRDMRDLRELDISLFRQLVALSEAIQDLKLNGTGDRYSETGSEYSMGTGSHMGSMSSLNDWCTEDEGDSETLDALLRYPSQSRHVTDADPVSEEDSSTSQLLMQIRDLALRADQDF